MWLNLSENMLLMQTMPLGPLSYQFPRKQIINHTIVKPPINMQSAHAFQKVGKDISPDK